MPRDGSGSYSLPSGQPVVTGSVISSSTFNSLTSDIATELTDSLSRSGKGAASANLSMGNNKITNLATATVSTDAVNLGQASGLPAGIGTGILCPADRLVISYATAATLSISADKVVLRDSSGGSKIFNTLSETLDISTTGANGRDVVDNSGNEDASVWYHLFAIGKADGTLDVFASQVGFPGSATSIYTRLPSGYTHAGYLGAVYNDSSSDLRETYQRGNLAAMGPGSSPILSGGSAATFTAISLVTEIPVTATAVGIDFLSQQATTTTSTRATVASGGSGTTHIGMRLIAEAIGASTSLMRARQGGEILLTTPQEIKYYVDSGSTCSLNATGWRY